MYNIKNGPRTIQFEGRLLGESSSWRPGSVRWIEFAIYRTQQGSYVLSRVGVSRVFHVAACPLVERYRLDGVPVDELHSDAVSCLECNSNTLAPMVFPEKYRHWAQVSEDPEAILDALYKTDEYGARYLTNVAQRVLESAADADPEIDSVYRVEIIP